MPSDLDTRFQEAAARAKDLPEMPDKETLLDLYALYKQGSMGDVQGSKPGFFDFVGVAKYEAWERLQGTPQDEAKQRYINLVDRLHGDR